MRIDAHHHLWAAGAAGHDWLAGPGMAPLRRTFGVADLAPLAAASGVERTVLVQVLATLEETAGFLALADRTPLIGGVVGWVDLTGGGRVAEDIAALRAGPGGHRLVGIRHLAQDEPDPSWLSRPDVLAGLRAVEAAGLAYDLLVRPPQLPAALAAVRAVPGLQFVLDHLGKPPIAAGETTPWADSLRELAAEPNVVAKLSGLVTEADWRRWTPRHLQPYVQTALDAFGPARLMFGSDWPVCLLAADYARVVQATEELLAGLSDAERTEVFAGTATRTYRVSPPRS